MTKQFRVLVDVRIETVVVVVEADDSDEARNLGIEKSLPDHRQE